jgi:TonB family protein
MCWVACDGGAEALDPFGSSVPARGEGEQPRADAVGADAAQKIERPLERCEVGVHVCAEALVLRDPIRRPQRQRVAGLVRAMEPNSGGRRPTSAGLTKNTAGTGDDSWWIASARPPLYRDDADRTLHEPSRPMTARLECNPMTLIQYTGCGEPPERPAITVGAAMFDRVGLPVEPSLSRGLPWIRLGFALSVLALCSLLVVAVRRHNSRSAVPEHQAHAIDPSRQSDAKAQTEVELGSGLEIGTWRVIIDSTHDVKDAGNAGNAPDQRDAVIFPGGELALSYGDSAYIVDGPGDDLNVYGPAGDRTPYTLFVRGGSADPWIHLDANGLGLPRGVASHDIRRQHVRQIKIRNDGTTNLFVDAVGILSRPGSARKDRVATSRVDPEVQPTAVSTRGVRTAPSVSAPGAVASKPSGSTNPATGGTSPPPASSPQATVAQPQMELRAPVQSQPAPHADPPPVVPLTADTADDRAGASSTGAPQRGPLQPPERIRRTRAKYPKVAEMANVEGTVIIEAVIDENGKITNPRILKSIPLLDAAALDAVKQWEFKPAMRDGRPVAVTAKLSVEFTLP